jgi:hypothetical protein
MVCWRLCRADGHYLKKGEDEYKRSKLEKEKDCAILVPVGELAE